MSRRAKGLELEEAFAAWLEGKASYTKTKQRVLINGKLAKRPYEVDVHGQRYSPVWRLAHVVGVAGMVLAIITMLMPTDMAAVSEAVEDTVSSLVPIAAGSGLLVFSCVAFIFGYLGKKRTTTHAWAECKNRKTAIKRADVEKLQGAVRDVRENPRADWKPERVMLVSGSGFDQDALAIAKSHGIECYKRTEQGFERVS